MRQSGQLVLIAALAVALTGAYAAAKAQSPLAAAAASQAPANSADYPPALTGLRGQYPSAVAEFERIQKGGFATLQAADFDSREQYDLVLVDAAPWDGRPEIVALACACDGVYLCLPEKDQETPETANLLQVIPEQGAPLRGCILTSR